MELEVKILIKEKIITLLRENFLYKRRGKEGGGGNQFCYGVLYLRGVWGGGKRIYCEERERIDWHNLLGWGLGGSRWQNTEGLVGWRVIPHTLLQSLLVGEEITPWTKRQWLISTRHTMLHIWSDLWIIWYIHSGWPNVSWIPSPWCMIQTFGTTS